LFKRLSKQTSIFNQEEVNEQEAINSGSRRHLSCRR